MIDSLEPSEASLFLETFAATHKVLVNGFR